MPTGAGHGLSGEPNRGVLTRGSLDLWERERYRIALYADCGSPSERSTRMMGSPPTTKSRRSASFEFAVAAARVSGYWPLFASTVEACPYLFTRSARPAVAGITTS